MDKPGICIDCSHRGECQVSSNYVRTCVNYEFTKRMSTESLCPKCKYQNMCLQPKEDNVITECSEFKSIGNDNK